MMKKRIILIIVLLLLFGWGGFYGSGYFYSMRHVAVNIPAVAELIPATPLAPGDLVTVQVKLTLPRCGKVVKVDFSPGEAMTAAENVRIVCIKGGWAQRIWQIEVPIRAIKPGTVPAGTMQITYTQGAEKGKNHTAAVTVPQITIGKGSVAENSAVELASESREQIRPRYHWLWWSLLLLLLIPLFWWIFRKKTHAAPPKTLKQRTLEALSALRGSLLKKEFSAEIGIARLSDVIRNYLELRYKMPVSKKTTPEFIEELERNNPLPEEDQPFLRNFLNAADLIKFAQAPCDETVVNSAIASAEKLVEQTAENEVEKEVSRV